MRPYDRLIGAALDGERWLFARQDTVEAAWRVVDPVLGDVVAGAPLRRGAAGGPRRPTGCCPTARPGTTRPGEPRSSRPQRRGCVPLPAASDIGVASAFGSWSEARGSLLQLLLNVVVLILVGLLTLRFVRLLWRRIRARRSREGK